MVTWSGDALPGSWDAAVVAGAHKTCVRWAESTVAHNHAHPCGKSCILFALHPAIVEVHSLLTLILVDCIAALLNAVVVTGGDASARLSNDCLSGSPVMGNNGMTVNNTVLNGS